MQEGRKKRVFWLLFLGLFFTLKIVLITIPVSAMPTNIQEEDKYFNPQSFDWSSGDYSKVSDWSSVNPSLIVRWDDVPESAYASMDFSSGQEKVPVANIDKIPKEKVDVLKVKYPAKLTSDQLLYNKNLNKFSDTKKLDEVVVNDVLSQFSKNFVLLQSSDSGTKVTLNNDGSVSFTKGNTLSIGDTINNVGIAGFTNARYFDGFLSAESGSWAIMKKDDEVLTTAQKFQNLAQDLKKNSMIVDGAQQIITRYVTTKNNKKTIITQKDGSTTLLSLEKQEYTMNHGGEGFQVLSKNQGSITTSKDFLKASNVELNFQSSLRFANAVTETVQRSVSCNNCERKTVDAGSCWTLSDTSSYTFSTIGTSIQLKSPDLLCIVDKPYTCADCSVFNTADRTIKTKSAILNIEKKLNGFDDYTAKTSGDAVYSLSDQFSLIETLDVSQSSFDSTISNYIKLRKGSEWMIKLENVDEANTQISEITGGSVKILFDKGNLTAVGENGEITVVHNPQETPATPQKLVAIPFIFSALFFLSLRKKGQISTFIILALIVFIIGIIIIILSQPSISSPLQFTAESFSKSCFDSSVQLMEGALSKQGEVPLRNSDDFFNVSIFLKNLIVQQPTIIEAQKEQEETLVKLYTQCIHNYEPVVEVVRQEQNPSVTIQHEMTKTLYQLRPATRITFSDGSSTDFRTSYTKTTTYPYKRFHETTKNIIESIQSTGYSPLYNEKSTDFWTVKGKTYVRLQDDNENYYHFSIDSEI